MTCMHTATEVADACVDHCPICQRAEIERLTAEVSEHQAEIKGSYLHGVEAGSAEMTAEVERLRGKLEAIATMPDEDNEWDGRDRFREVRDIAREGVAYQRSANVINES